MGEPLPTQPLPEAAEGPRADEPASARPPPLVPMPTASQPAQDPLLGRTIAGRFQILSVLARGGMGKVYRAEQSPLGRVCAVKVLQPNYQGESDPEFSKRFFLEASVVSKLKHPNTVTVFDYGQTEDGVYYMAMELLEGRTLHRLLREQSPLEPARAVHILLQVARSLREAHAQGVIHRDLKPANIFLIQHDEDEDFVKVLDFGLVKNVAETDGESLTQTGLFMGSPKYMAPEQIRGEKVSAATDLYALGVILFEMLTGKVPFDRPNSVNTLMAHVSEAVPRLQAMNPAAQASPALEEFVYRCLEKRPEARFATTEEFIAALKRAGGVPSGAYTSMTGEHLPSVPAPLATHPSGESPLRLVPRSDRPSATASAELVPTLTAPTSGEQLAVSSVRPEPEPAPAAPPVRVSTPPESASTPWARYAMVGTLLFVATVAITVLYRAKTMPRAETTPTVSVPHEVTVELAIDSVPSGATVLEGSRVLGTTPLRSREVHTEGFNADAPRALTLQLDGHEPESVSVQGRTVTRTVTLRSAAPVVAPTPTPPQTPSVPSVPVPPRVHRPRTGEGPQAPAGYRQDPYG